MTTIGNPKVAILLLVALVSVGFVASMAQAGDKYGTGHPIDPAQLQKCSFEWKALWAHSPGNKSEDIEKMADLASDMGFNAIMSSANAEVIEAVHKKGMKFYAWVINLRGLVPRDFYQAHPEYLQKIKPEEQEKISQPRVNPDRVNIHGGNWLCPDRGLIEEEKQAIQAIVKNYDIDGLALDYVGYRNYCACFCDYSQQKREEYAKQHPDLSPAEVLRRFSEDSLVNYVEQLREAAKAIKPEIKIAIHIYPDFDPNPLYSNRLAVDYCGQTVAWFYKPFWPYEKIYQLTCQYQEAEGKYHKFNQFVPFVGVYSGERLKSPERLRTEIRIAGAAGTKKIMMAFYHTFLKQPELAEVVTQELK